MQASDYSTWRQFFREASIPDEYAKSYANIFTENRMRLDMLADLDRTLLNEMGIVAIGDCLSILKHAKATCSKIKTNKQEDQAPASLSRSIESISSNESPKPPRIAKRIVDRLISDTDYKSTGSTVTPNHNYTNSTLSTDLLTRLNFNPSNMSSTSGASSPSPVKQQPVVRFNKDSLEPSKVIVSSTTGDTDDSQSPKKIISLKRKLYDDVKPKLESVVVDSSRSIKPTTNSIFSGISITTDSKSKVVKLAGRNDLTNSDTEKKHSVFKRIKSSNTNDKPTTVSVSFPTSHSTSSLGSKVISLTKNKSQLDQLANNKKVKSIKDRLSFN